MSEATYERLLEVARSFLSNGRGCVLDGTFSSSEWRLKSRELAEDLAVPFQSIWCTCPEEIALQRLESRRGDVSDATRETYLSMKEAFAAPESESSRVDTSGELDEILRLLAVKLRDEAWRKPAQS